MTSLLLSTWSLPSARALADAARNEGWSVCALDENPASDIREDRVYYGGSDVALSVASRFRLALLEPPLDLLARLPIEYRQREVEYCRFGDLRRLRIPTFVKPADALNKAFDAGIYADVRDIRACPRIDAKIPVLVSEPVQWLAEYRCFIVERKVAATSPYLSFGRPVWRPYGQGGKEARPSTSVLSFCERLLSQSKRILPPAFVLDVGLIEERGWAVVEFNPAWCSGVLGADPKQVLAVLRRSCHDRGTLPVADRQWVLDRGRL